MKSYTFTDNLESILEKITPPLVSLDAKWHEAADGIRVVHEMEEGGSLPEFQRASRMLEDAARVYIIGFSMGKTNINNIPFFSKDYGLSRFNRVQCAVGELNTRESGELLERLKGCNFLEDRHLLKVNSDKFFERFGFQ